MNGTVFIPTVIPISGSGGLENIPVMSIILILCGCIFIAIFMVWIMEFIDSEMKMSEHIKYTIQCISDIIKRLFS